MIHTREVGKLKNKYYYREKELIQHIQYSLKLLQSKNHKEWNNLKNSKEISSLFLLAHVFNESINDPEGQVS